MSEQKVVAVLSDQLINRLCARMFGAVLKPGGISREQFEAALARSELEDLLTAAVLRCANKVSGLVTPLRAQDTGLIPDGWTVENDNLEGEIDLAKLDYSSCPVREGEDLVNGDTMLERAGNALGSLGFAAALLKAQDEGKEIFPVESRGKHHFIMPCTILRDGHRHRRVTCFCLVSGRWVSNFRWLGLSHIHGFGANTRFVRLRE